MKITVRIEKVYGRELIYPVCEMAKSFTAMAGCKCLNRRMLKKIEAMGYEIEVQAPTLDAEPESR